MRIAVTEIPSDWTQQIEEIARTTGRTSGAVIREAIAQYLSKTDSLTGQFVNANIASAKQQIVSFCSELHNPFNLLCDNFTRASEYFQQLLQLLHLYAKYYSPCVSEIQQKAEDIDLEFLVEDLPKLLNSIKVGSDYIYQTYQSVFNSSRLDEAQAVMVRAAVAKYLGKTDSLKPLVQYLQEANFLASLALVELVTPNPIRLSLEPLVVKSVWFGINNSVCFMYGNLPYIEQYAQELLLILRLYAKHYSPPVLEIQQYIEAINLEFLVEELLNVLNSLKIEGERLFSSVSRWRAFARVSIDLHESLDFIVQIWQTQLKASTACIDIHVIKEYGSVPQLMGNSAPLNRVIMNVLSLAINDLEESIISKLEARARESNSEPLAPILEPTLRICSQTDDRNQVVIGIGNYLIQVSLDSEYRLHAEAEPAIKWGDGYGLYCYHGVILPEKYGKLPPREWQSQWLLSENNAELRRVLIQGIGYARICTELQATELDSWAEYSLLKIDQIIDVDREPIYLLKMTCPSTGFIHALRVPPDMRSAREAISWVNWGVDPLEFSVQT